MPTQIKFLKQYLPVLMHKQHPSRYTRAEITQRLLAGEEVDPQEIGIDEIICTSGRVSGKTHHGDIATVKDLYDGVGDVWYCRSEDGDIRTSIFTGLLSTITEMGYSYSNRITADFKVSYSPFEITCNRNGNKVQFFGINKDINRTKGRVAPSGKLQRLIIEEANECDSGMYIDAVVSTAIRFMDTGAHIEYRYNPPMTRQHWCFEYFDKKVRKGARRIYTTWEDLARAGMLTPGAIAEILAVKKTDPLMYRYWYLGEVVNLSGMVYPQFDRKKHVVNIYNLLAQGDKISELILGVDEGTVNDSTCVTPGAVMQSGKCVVLDLYEHSPTDRTGQQGTVGQYSASEQSRELYIWLNRLMGIFPQLRLVPRMWIFESAEGGQILRNQFVDDFGENTCLVTKKSIWGDVKRVRNMLSEGVLYFHVAPNVNTDTLCKDIENYVIDEKTNDIKKDQREDSIDSMEYMTKLYYDRPL